MDYLDEIAREQRNQIEAVEKGFDPFHISPEDIEKGRKAQLGEIRHWKDGDYKMTVNGWEYVKGSDPNIKSKKKSEEPSKEKVFKVGDKVKLKVGIGLDGNPVISEYSIMKYSGSRKLEKDEVYLSAIQTGVRDVIITQEELRKHAITEPTKTPEKKEGTAADAFPKMQEHLNKLNLSFVQLPRDLDSSGKWGEEKSFIVEPKNAGSLQVIYEKITGTSKWARDGSGNIYGNIHFRWNYIGGGSNGYSVKLKFDKSGNLLKTTRG